MQLLNAIGDPLIWRTGNKVGGMWRSTMTHISDFATLAVSGTCIKPLQDLLKAVQIVLNILMTSL